MATQEPNDDANAPPAPEVQDPPPRVRRRRGRPSRARGKPHSSDDASGRWTVRGVPPPVREMALRQAAQRGMTVGDWVAEAIISFARAAERSRADSTKLPAAEAPPDMTQVIARLDERLTRIEARQAAGFFGRLFGRRR